MVGSGLVQHLVLSALQMAVSERMKETAERARAAVRDEVLGIVTEDAGAERTEDAGAERTEDAGTERDVSGATGIR
jgi:hypothetical protein